MSKSTWVMIAAVALAAGVMLLAYLAEPGKPAGPETAVNPPIPGQHDLSWGDAFNPKQNRNAGNTNPLQSVGKTRFDTYDEKGRLQIYKGDPITPLPDGWWSVGKPEFIYHLSEQRVLKLVAREGRLYAPAEPRSGLLTGNVTLQYYDTQDDTRSLKLEEAQNDLRFAMQMDSVQFDRDLFRLETDGQFHMTSPEFDYRGSGLRLVYSDANRRIETLQVQRSQQLRIVPGQNDQRKSTPQQADDSTAGNTPEQSADRTSRPVQYYRATFPIDVRIASRQVQVQCEQLQLIFSLQDQGGQSQLLNSLGRSQDDPDAARLLTQVMTAAGSPLEQAMQQLVAWTMAQTAESAEATGNRTFTSLAPNTDEDIVITWEGALTVEPVTPQVALAGPEDVWVELVGKPVRVTGERGEVVKSASLTYLVSGGQLALLGNGAYPVEIDSPQLGGVLQGNHLTINQKSGAGKMHGPGMIQAYRDRPAVLPVSQERDALAIKDDRLPAGFSIGWSEAMDLTFYKRPPREGKPRNNRSPMHQDPIQISALREAVFHGQVSVAHPQFDMRSQQLSLAMGDPAAGRQIMENLTASGQVTVSVRGQSLEDQGSIACDDLTILLAADEQGRTQPKRFIARGNVIAHTVDGKLKTKSLIAELSPRAMDEATVSSESRSGPLKVVHLQPAAGEGEPAVSGDPFAEVLTPAIVAPPDLVVPMAAPAVKQRSSPIRQIVAEDGVEIEMSSPPMRISAQRLVTDIGPVETQIELFGSDQSVVQVQREGMLIAGQRVVFTRNARTLHIPGQGMMAFFSRQPLKIDGTPDQALSLTQDQLDMPATRVNVTWNQAMHFDDRGGAAQFLGDVVIIGEQERESTRLACQDLRLEFLKTPQATFGLESDTDLTEQEKVMRAVREVRSVVAREDVVFEAQAMGRKNAAAPANGKPESRVRIVGPLMTFDGLREQVQVIGPGTMSIEDYRTSRAGPTDRAGLPLQQMVSSGATAFRWAGSLLLDAAHNDMVISQAVQMIHMPSGADRAYQLDCRHLVADLDSTGGLGSIARAPTPQVRAVYADGAVRLLTGDRQVTTDHLEYNGKNEVVLLSADPGKYTTISEARTPVPLTYRQVRWFLKENKFEGIEPGRGVVPLLRDSRRR